MRTGVRVAGALLAVGLLGACGTEAGPISATSPSALPSEPTGGTSAGSPSASGMSMPPSSPSADQTIAVAVAGGKVTPKPGRIKVAKGSTVELVVTSDVADEVHLHGYDKSTDVAAGGVAKLDFTASIPGTFEVELESKGLLLTELQVS